MFVFILGIVPLISPFPLKPLAPPYISVKLRAGWHWGFSAHLPINCYTPDKFLPWTQVWWHAHTGNHSATIEPLCSSIVKSLISVSPLKQGPGPPIFPIKEDFPPILLYRRALMVKTSYICFRNVFWTMKFTNFLLLG